jgi:VCBS repeat protein
MPKYRTCISQLLVLAVGLLYHLPVMLAQGNVPAAAQQGNEKVTRLRKFPDPPSGVLYDPGAPLSDRSFFIHDIGHRCLDFGPPSSWVVASPVFIYSCNGTVAQQVRVKEVDDTHDVKLLVANLCIGVRGGVVAVGRALELQLCHDASPAQRFAFDGDAILVGDQSGGRVSRKFVIEPKLGYTPSFTPLVVGVRKISDAEYFRFEAVDRSLAFPTTGFVRVSSEAGLDWALNLGWGAVIEIDPAQPLELMGPFPKQIHTGITLRGYRKHIDNGPEIHTCTVVPVDPADPNAGGLPTFMITEDDVRITGLRLRGPVNDPRCPSSNLLEARAIRIESPGAQVPIVWIDHLDISYFTGHAVDTAGTDPSESQVCPIPPLAYPRSTPVRVIGNFIHHNSGYGSVTGNGAFTLNQGNIFYRQGAHDIVSDAWGTTGYNAYDNFILSEKRDTDQIDMHGSLHPPNWYDGLSGDHFDIGWNTFLHTGGHKPYNINQRGTPCRFTAIHDNIFLQSQNDAVLTSTTDPGKHVVYSNTFDAPNPTADLAVGDFDGDGITDVFVGTGQAWYFSSGGQAEWRFLNRMPEHASSLLFGDLDGDGRTDVIALHGANIDVSWGGISPWQTINNAALDGQGVPTGLPNTAWKLSDMAVGDFDGDSRADLFLATGMQWFFAPGGKNWTPFDTSSYRRPDLLFGDFTHLGRTQALRVHDGQWLVASLGMSWKSIGTVPNIGGIPLSSTAGLVVGDFNGDGFADVATNVSAWWASTTPAHGGIWSMLRPDTNNQIASRPIGDFNGDHTSDVLLWDSLHFSFAPSGRNPVQPLSRQDMR